MYIAPDINFSLQIQPYRLVQHIPIHPSWRCNFYTQIMNVCQYYLRVLASRLIVVGDSVTCCFRIELVTAEVDGVSRNRNVHVHEAVELAGPTLFFKLLLL